MVDLDKIGIDEILKDTILLLNERDIFYYCENDEVAERIYAEIENKNRMATTQEAMDIMKVLKDAEPFIDKEKFIKRMIRNYANYYNDLIGKAEVKISEAIKIVAGKVTVNLSENQIDKILREIEKCKESAQVFDKIITSYCKQTGTDPMKCKERVTRLILSGKGQTIKEISDAIYDYNTMSERIDSSTKKMETYLKGRRVILPSYYYDEEDKKFEIEILIPEGLKDEYKDGKFNLKKIKKLTTCFGEKIDGIAIITQAIILDDLEQIFSDQEFGQYLKLMIMENVALKRGNKHEEIERLRNEDQDEHERRTKWDKDFIPETAEAIRRYGEFADVDKLLLISAFRFNNHLENGVVNLENVSDVRKILKGIYDNIGDKTQGISCELNMEKDGEKEIHIEYSPDDLKECLANFTSHEYVTKKQKEEYRKQIEEKEIEFIDIDPEKIDIIFTKEEQESLSMLSDNNLYAIATLNKWSSEKIAEFITKKNGCSNLVLNDFINDDVLSMQDVMKLYTSGIVGIELFDKISIEKAKEVISVEELVDLYNTTTKNISEEEKEKNIDAFEKYLNVYKTVLSKENDEEKENNENELIACVFDKIDDEVKLKDALANLYSKGLLKIDTIIDWYGYDIVDTLFDRSLVNLDDIKRLTADGKIPIEYISKKYVALIQDEEMSYDERMEYIRSGFVDEEEIFKLFYKNLLYETHLNKLKDEGFVREKECDWAIKFHTLKKREENAQIVLHNVEEKKKIEAEINDISNDKNNGYSISVEPKKIIDPEMRDIYICLFNACSAEKCFNLSNMDIELKDHPFYHYEFYTIPDETGDLGPNSVVIAERYYKDIDNKKEPALGNATYFFKYKDFLVLSKLNKSEMDKERENIVFRVNHNRASEKKIGSWAINVLYCIAKTMLSSDLKEYTAKQRRQIVVEKMIQMYGYNRFSEILDLAGSIDEGEHDIDISETGIVSKTIKGSKGKKEENDDNEGFEMDD